MQIETQRKFNEQSGMTVIEIVVVIGIFAILAASGLFLSMDFYRAYAANSELVTIVSSLGKARNQSLANLNEKEHGLHIETDKYVIFEGAVVPAVYDSGAASNLDIPAGSNTTVSGPSEIIFERLTGKARSESDDCPCTISFTTQGQTKEIDINSEGGIEW